MGDIKDSRKIVYVFDASCAKKDYGVVKEHVINYLNAFEVSIDKGDFLHSSVRTGLDYYEAVFSCPFGEIELTRASDLYREWVLKIPNKGEIAICDNGNIIFNGKFDQEIAGYYTRYPFARITVDFAKNGGSFEYTTGYHRKSKGEVLYSSEVVVEQHVKLGIYTDKFGNIKITLFYEGPKGSVAKKHFVLIGGHKYSVQEYIAMLNDGIRDEKIPLEEQKLISAMFNDPRISSMLENFLAKIPASLDEWHRLQSIAIDNDYAAVQINEQNRFAEEQRRLQEDHDQKVAKAKADYDKQVDRLNVKVMELASKLAEDSSDDKGGPVFVKSGRRGKNNI